MSDEYYEKRILISEIIMLKVEGFDPEEDVDEHTDINKIKKIIQKQKKLRKQKEEDTYLERFDSIRDFYVKTDKLTENQFNQNVKEFLQELEDSKVVFTELDTGREMIDLIKKLSKKYFEELNVNHKYDPNRIYQLSKEEKLKMIGVSFALVMG